jgi:hypothetical protein
LEDGDREDQGDHGRWGIEFPAIPELDIEGVDVSADIDPDEIIPVF